MSDVRWLRPIDVAKHLGLSTRTIYAACRTGVMRHARVGRGRSIVIEQQWADDYLRSCARGGAAVEDSVRGPAH